ncbi:unnamed protein product [Clonostachys solani]|uniref:Phenylacetate 2-hydroxylase n=1 Tax=Clonostachys solani TaxID=160281 RepID=A0A9N9Z8S7_9HYPO|nr:unnamed protein product [Clonostachys solani]
MIANIGHSFSLNGPIAFLALVVVIVVSLLVYLNFFYVDIPKINGIPEIPNGELLAGHLYQLGADHATTAEKWSAEYRWPVFQVRMGRRRAIFLNSFESAREWLVKNSTATVDRPWFYTFHGVVSATSAATIGTSPWNERTKKQRRVVGSFTTGPAMARARPMIDMESSAVIASLYRDTDKGRQEVIPHVYLKRLALNMMLKFCYGTRMNSVANPLLLQILEDATTIASFRSTNSNPQDFIPHLRYLAKSDRTATALEVRARRDNWLNSMLDKVKSALKPSESDKKPIAEMLLEDNTEGLTQMDIKTILGGLMSGGFETVFSTAIITIGLLSTPEGQILQQEAYDDLMSAYDSPEEAFRDCMSEEKSPYIAGMVKESLRFYPPLKILPARQTFKEFEYNGAKIPRGVLVYTNTQAVNHDKSSYGPDADKFRPRRWIDKEYNVPAPYHFAFGAGGRMCTAVNFSNRVLYTIYARLILSFRITESQTNPANTHYIHYKRDPSESNSIASEFKVRFTPRDRDVLERCLTQAGGRLADFNVGEDSEPLF